MVINLPSPPNLNKDFTTSNVYSLNPLLSKIQMTPLVRLTNKEAAETFQSKDALDLVLKMHIKY